MLYHDKYKHSPAQRLMVGTMLALGSSYFARRRPVGTLRELLPFVNDRIVGYECAGAANTDPQLCGYYEELVSQSQQFATGLNSYLNRESGNRETSAPLKGQLYQCWLDVKAALTGRNEKEMLAANLCGEEWALEAYEEALADHALRGTLRQAVECHYALSQHTYKQLQKLATKQ